MKILQHSPHIKSRFRNKTPLTFSESALWVSEMFVYKHTEIIEHVNKLPTFKEKTNFKGK